MTYQLETPTIEALNRIEDAQTEPLSKEAEAKFDDILAAVIRAIPDAAITVHVARLPDAITRDVPTGFTVTRPNGLRIDLNVTSGIESDLCIGEFERLRVSAKGLGVSLPLDVNDPWQAYHDYDHTDPEGLAEYLWFALHGASEGVAAEWRDDFQSELTSCMERYGEDWSPDEEEWRYVVGECIGGFLKRRFTHYEFFRYLGDVMVQMRDCLWGMVLGGCVRCPGFRSA